MRLPGMLAVLMACLGIGLQPLRRIKRELRCLEGLCLGLRAMREELAGSLRPLGELLERAAALTEGEARAFFLAAAVGMAALREKSFAEIWQAACRALPPLPEPLCRELEALGLTLGRAAPEDQLAALDRWLLRAGKALDERRSRLPEQRRLTLALSAAAGVFLSLLLV